MMMWLCVCVCVCMCVFVSVCPVGHYGVNCAHQCDSQCDSKLGCDPVTGACRCPSGSTGELCRQSTHAPLYSLTSINAVWSRDWRRML